MSRIRTIKPSFFKNEELADLEPITRLLFIGLWTLCDSGGKMEDRPKRIKVEVLAYDDIDVDHHLDILHNKNFIVRYQAEDKAYIKVLTFNTHQRITGSEATTDSIIPEPTESTEKKLVIPSKHLGSTLETPRTTGKERKGREGKGRERSRPPAQKKFHSDSEKISFEKFEDWLQKHTPRIQQLKSPFTIDHYLKLKKLFSTPEEWRQLQDVFLAMENKADLLKKYTSALLTAKNWMDRRIKDQKQNSNFTNDGPSITEKKSQQILDSVG